MGEDVFCHLGELFTQLCRLPWAWLQHVRWVSLTENTGGQNSGDTTTLHRPILSWREMLSGYSKTTWSDDFKGNPKTGTVGRHDQTFSTAFFRLIWRRWFLSACPFCLCLLIKGILLAKFTLRNLNCVLLRINFHRSNAVFLNRNCAASHHTESHNSALYRRAAYVSLIKNPVIY